MKDASGKWMDMSQRMQGKKRGRCLPKTGNNSFLEKCTPFPEMFIFLQTFLEFAASSFFLVRMQTWAFSSSKG